MQGDNTEKIKVLLSNEDFMIKLLSQDTAEDVKLLFKEECIEVTDKDVELLGEVLINLVNRGGELTEEDLAKISGGVNLNYDTRDGYNLLFNTNVCNCINTDVIKYGGKKLVIGSWIGTNQQSM